MEYKSSLTLILRGAQMNKFDLRKVKWGDIFTCNLGNGKGSVEHGIRPVIIVQTNKLNYSSPTVTVATITSVLKKQEMGTHILLGKECGLDKDSMIMLEQMRTIDKAEELFSYVGRVTDEGTIVKIKDGLRYQFNLMRQPKPRRTGLILSLCPTCLGEFFSDPNNILRRVDPLQVEKELCDKCQVRYGYDYLIMKKVSYSTENGGKR